MVKLAQIVEYFAYRGDDTEFDNFDVRYIGKSTGTDTGGFWFTSNKINAAGFGDNVNLFRINIDNPLIVSYENFVGAYPKGPPYWAHIAKTKGHDGVILKNIVDGSQSANSTYCVFSPKQIQHLKKTNIDERKLDMSKKEDAAEFLIRKAWKFIPPGEDRYDSFDVIIWIDNEKELNELAWKLAKQFYPGEEEAWYHFQDDIKNALIKLEQERLERKRKKNPSLKDPEYILKKLMVGATWDQAKKAIWNQLATSGHKLKRKIPDEDAEQVFNRLYKNAMGETVYDSEFIEKYGYGRLSDMEIKPSDSNHIQYNINVFLRHYGRGNKIDGKVRVWRGTNSPHAKIRPGDYVTFDRGYSQAYLSGKWKSIVTDVLDAKDLIVYKFDPGTSELIYWPEGHEVKKYEGEIPTLRDFWSMYRFGI